MSAQEPNCHFCFNWSLSAKVGKGVLEGWWREGGGEESAKERERGDPAEWETETEQRSYTGMKPASCPSQRLGA